ncbi:MAG: Cna B-type domain-containing protein, partial [Bulleidia sp.]
FNDLPKYRNGKAIVYTVTEDAVKDYSTEIEGYNITNSYTPGKTSVTVTKSWEDGNNQDGLRPDSVTVQLYADSDKYGDAITLDDANNWTYTWDGLDEMKAGAEISYAVEEITKVDGYSAAVAGNAAAGYIITNFHTPETVSVAGTKTWDDGNNQDGKRPGSITVNLLADGVKIDSRTVSADENGSWTYSFENLPKYENGTEIVYSVSEEPIADYSTAINGYDITNSYTPGKTSVTVTKVWNDSNNRDGLRPSAESFASEVHLYNGDTEVTGVTPVVTDNGNNTYTVTYSDLPAYADGIEITYTVRENAISGYTADQESVRNGEALTNTHSVTPAPSPTSAPTPTNTPTSSAPADQGSGRVYTPNTSAASGTNTAARPYTPNTSDQTSVPLYAGIFLVSSAVILMMLMKWRKELFRR